MKKVNREVIPAEVTQEILEVPTIQVEVIERNQRRSIIQRRRVTNINTTSTSTTNTNIINIANILMTMEVTTTVKEAENDPPINQPTKQPTNQSVKLE